MLDKQIPFFDLKRTYYAIEGELNQAIRHTLESGHWILGRQLESFEENFRQQVFGSSQEKYPGHCLGCNSGTDALILALLALGIQKDDEVLVPSHTAIPTITAIRTAGAKPVFCDIHPETWLIDLQQIEQKVTPRCKAVIAVHLYGNMVDIFALKTLLQKLNRTDIKIIEDVAQAHGAKLKNAQNETFSAGALGDCNAFSFYPTKNIGAIGDGGGISTQDPKIAEKIRYLRNYGQRDRYNAILEGGLNSRLDEVQAAVLTVKLKYLEKWNAKKKDFLEKYREELGSLPLQFQKTTENCEPAWHLAVIRLESKKVRDDLQNYLTGQGVHTLIHYPLPTHQQEAFHKFKTSLPLTEKLATEILSLPMNAHLLGEEVSLVIEKVRDFFKS